MNAEQLLKEYALRALADLYKARPDDSSMQVQKTRKEFAGDYTLVTFPLLKISRKGPEDTAREIGDWLEANAPQVEAYNVIKGFLNVTFRGSFWAGMLGDMIGSKGYASRCESGRTVMVEYSSPNTNKPLHLGHIRNNLLGWSVAQILEANGDNVIKANLVNDRGIHICKSMIAWHKYGEGETPESSGMKGDKLVGKYYVEFDKRYKAQITELTEAGMPKEEAERKAPVILEAQEMLRKWEAKDPEVYKLWQTMNSWVYDGFKKTYRDMGVSFDKVYYESDTYLLGKELVQQGLDNGVFFRKDDGSVWVDLTDEGLDQKLLLRGDGTSVYMTQDLGTAVQRFNEYKIDGLIYVVGNEQNYHFQVLKLILGKLGYGWSDHIYHLSYGMVELPAGKMKSREGTVVDADDLMEEMVETAREMSKELGKLDELSPEEADRISTMIGMGALKYFILKVDPRKTMLFNPAESIDFNGNTAPFIQYTHARIKSLARRAADQDIQPLRTIEADQTVEAKEVELVKLLLEFGEVIAEAGRQLSPALIANYVYELAKEYNQYYHDYPILKEGVDPQSRPFRLALSLEVADVIDKGMRLLGIDVPERM